MRTASAHDLLAGGLLLNDAAQHAGLGTYGNISALDGQIKVPRVIANVEPTDRISYMTPDAVSGDQNLYVKQYRSEIRLALGVDDIDIGTAGTAYEIKTLYGRVASQQRRSAVPCSPLVCAVCLR